MTKISQYFILIFFSFLFIHCEKNHKETNSLEPQEKKVEFTIQQIQESIKKGTDYIKQQGINYDPLLIPIVDYMNLYENQKINIPYEEIYHFRMKDSSFVEAYLIPYFLGYKKEIPLPSQQEVSKLPRLDQAIVYAFNCDTYSLPSHYTKLVERLAKDSLGYGMTHAALVIQWIKDKNCTYDDPSILLEDLKPYFSQIINKKGPLTDLKAEAMAIAYYLDWDAIVSDKNIFDLLDNQHESGAWLWNKKDIAHKGNHHFSTLAVWALIGYLHQNKTRIPWN